MTDARGTGPGEARAQLEAAALSRRAAVRSTRRPAWIDAAISLVAGTSVALGLAGHGLVATSVLAPGCLIVLVARRAVVRRQGQLFEPSAVRARLWRFAVLFAVLVLLSVATPPAGWREWYPLAVGLVAAVGGFAWLRWEDRDQGRRLAADDRGHDLR